MLDIYKRCDISQKVNSVLELLYAELETPEERAHAEALLHERFRAPKTESEDKMNYEQAKVFRETIIPFGLHRGSKIGEVPIDYLIWISDQTEWHKKVQRYIRYEKGLQGCT